MLSRREALIGAGAVVASAALPLPVIAEGSVGLIAIDIAQPWSLDAIGAIYGLYRYSETCVNGLLSNETFLLPIESDASYRQRLRDHVQEIGNKYFTNTTSV